MPLKPFFVIRKEWFVKSLLTSLNGVFGVGTYLVCTCYLQILISFCLHCHTHAWVMLTVRASAEDSLKKDEDNEVNDMLFFDYFMTIYLNTQTGLQIKRIILII